MSVFRNPLDDHVRGAGIRDVAPDGIEPFQSEFLSEATRLTEVRHRLREWLERGGIGSDQIYDVLLAVDEACTNAVEHGYRHGPGIVRLRGAISGSDLYLSIVDRGSWEPAGEPANPLRGRGLMMMRALVTDVDISSGPEGTRVDLRAEIRSAHQDSAACGDGDRGADRW
ncbi:ATP-binding protein [Nocardia spumae]|uniref:ATP-binding protein n=1 Tax=Nocardia spumae TaxID=2887190 RepID=UPI001D149EEF|nr:ATP-binding protein [Nocardia spumae]